MQIFRLTALELLAAKFARCRSWHFLIHRLLKRNGASQTTHTGRARKALADFAILFSGRAPESSDARGALEVVPDPEVDAGRK
jgi:hypothetical protein